MRDAKTYRLLSEAEREYVTRAGRTTPFWWGSFITPRLANQPPRVSQHSVCLVFPLPELFELTVPPHSSPHLP
jgi:hypothetical protein